MQYHLNISVDPSSICMKIFRRIIMTPKRYLCDINSRYNDDFTKIVLWNTKVYDFSCNSTGTVNLVKLSVRVPGWLQLYGKALYTVRSFTDTGVCIVLFGASPKEHFLKSHMQLRTLLDVTAWSHTKKYLHVAKFRYLWLFKTQQLRYEYRTLVRIHSRIPEAAQCWLYLLYYFKY